MEMWRDSDGERERAKSCALPHRNKHTPEDRRQLVSSLISPSIERRERDPLEQNQKPSCKYLLQDNAGEVVTPVCMWSNMIRQVANQIANISVVYFPMSTQL